MELEKYPTVQSWTNRLSESSKETYLSYFSRFMEWLKKHGGEFKDYTPDQLIEYQKKCDNGSRYDILDTAQRYINQYQARVNTKNTAYGTIRSFFMHNRAELPKDPGFMIRSKKPPTVGTLTAEEIKQVILSCNPAYQAVYLVMFQAALDHQLFMYWNTHGYQSLIEQLRENPEVIKIDLPGRKKYRNEKPYYSFIGRDAIEALRNWFQHRPENSEAIITNQFGKPIQSYDLKTYWIRHLRKIGIVGKEKGKPHVSRTGKNLHEMRDVFRSLWSRSPAKHWMAEYFMGHSIDPLEYDKSFRQIEDYKTEYMKAAPYLNIMSRGEAFGLVEKTEIQRLEKTHQQENRELRKDIEEMKKIIYELGKKVNSE
ncbi:hypothetical protein KQH65_06745 [archaeon]|nr:hypothetical protein [archaeon]